MVFTIQIEERNPFGLHSTVRDAPVVLRTEKDPIRYQPHGHSVAFDRQVQLSVRHGGGYGAVRGGTVSAVYCHHSSYVACRP